MTDSNSWVAGLLNDFLRSISKKTRYFVIGSVSLMSYTKASGYERKIKDIDIICDGNDFKTVVNRLRSLGYRQDTFIDGKFPFFKRLDELSSSKYFRFVKKGKSLEIMTSDFGNLKTEIKVEIYPGISFLFPKKGLVLSSYNGIKFRSVSKEALYCIYSVGIKTWGKFVKSNITQRRNDIEKLYKNIDKDKLKDVADKIYLRLGRFTFKVPTRLMVS